MTNSQGKELQNGVDKITMSISSIGDLFVKLPNTDLQSQLQTWINRNNFYQQLYPNDSPLAQWLTSKKLTYQLKKLMHATQAFTILLSIYPQFNIEQKKIADRMLEITNRTIDIQLKKIEIAQLRKIKNVQHINRSELENLQNDLIQLTTLNRIAINKTKTPYSSRVKELVTLPLLNQTSAQPDLKIIKDLFKTEEKKVHFSKHLKRADKLSDTQNIAAQSVGFYATLGSLFPNIVRLGSMFKAFVKTIPATSLLINAVPHAISLIKSIAHRNASKKIIGPIVVVGLSTAAFAITSFVPITGIIIAFTCVMASVSLGLGAILPLWQTSSLQKIKNKELAELTQIELDREKESKGLSTGFLSLTETEKRFLLVKLETFYLKNPENNLSLLHTTKKLIDSGDYISISKDPIIKKMIEQKSGHERNLSGLLTKCNQSAKKQVTQELAVIKKDLSSKRIELVNGALSWIGIGLVCIPTPATIILGASLLFASSIIELGMKYDWSTKIKNVFSRLFSRHKDKTIEDPEGTHNNIKLHKNMGIETHAIVKKKMAESGKKPLSITAPDQNPQPQTNETNPVTYTAQKQHQTAPESTNTPSRFRSRSP